MNSYESGDQKVIPAVLVYVFNEDRVLMIHRNQKSSDFHKGKWNGLGGKLEVGESPVQAAVREVEEESGLMLSPNDLSVVGVLQFPMFKPHKHEDWLVYVLTASVSSPVRSLKECSEGNLNWIPVEGLLELNLWDGDRVFIPRVLDRDSFVGTFWYKDKKLNKHWIQSL